MTRIAAKPLVPAFDPIANGPITFADANRLCVRARPPILPSLFAMFIVGGADPSPIQPTAGTDGGVTAGIRRPVDGYAFTLRTLHCLRARAGPPRCRRAGRRRPRADRVLLEPVRRGLGDLGHAPGRHGPGPPHRHATGARIPRGLPTARGSVHGRLVHARGGRVANANGTGEICLTDTPEDESEPAWSPDGGRIAFARNNDLWVIDADEPDQSCLAATPGSSEVAPAWSPDGSLIAYLNMSSSVRGGICGHERERHRAGTPRGGCRL